MAQERPYRLRERWNWPKISALATLAALVVTVLTSNVLIESLQRAGVGDTREPSGVVATGSVHFMDQHANMRAKSNPLGASSMQKDSLLRDEDGNQDWLSQDPEVSSDLAYQLELLIERLARLKIKDHRENPTQTPLKDGIIRVITGGTLFALPIIAEALMDTESLDGETVAVGEVNRVRLGLTGEAG